MGVLVAVWASWRVAEALHAFALIIHDTSLLYYMRSVAILALHALGRFAADLSHRLRNLGPLIGTLRNPDSQITPAICSVSQMVTSIKGVLIQW